MLTKSNKLTMTPLEHRVRLFQELIQKGEYFSIKNFNLDFIKERFRKGKGTYLKPQKWEVINYLENRAFY